MIVVKVELHGAVSKTVTTLAKIHIANDGTSLEPRVGHYLGRFWGKGGSPLKKGRSFEVRQWPRQSRSVLSLLRAMLENAGY